MTALPTNTGPGALPDPLARLIGNPRNTLSQLDKFLTTPGGGFLMNLLAQSGYSPVPQSPFGAIGKAALMTQHQGQARGMNDLQRRFIEAQIGKLSRPDPSALPKATTDRGKAIQDFNNGIISKETLDKRLREIDMAQTRLGNQDAAALRSERDRVIKGTTDALQSLRAGESLLNAKNPFADVASLTSFIKSIDNSVVRPAEMDAYNASLGLLNQMESIWQRAKGDGVLTPPARKALAESMAALRENYETILKGQEEFFTNEAGRSGIDPVRVNRGANPGSISFKPDDDSENPDVKDIQDRIDALPDGPVKDALMQSLQELNSG